jgi:hypothetical protein
MQSPTEFLTLEECAEVDQALLTSHDRFTVRVATYALRSLKRIAQAQGVAIVELTPAQIEDWIYQDESLQGGIDQEFKPFFSKLVMAAQKTLHQASKEISVDLEAMTLTQLIHWFEQNARERLNQQSHQ